MKSKLSIASSLALIAALLVTALAVADTVQGDSVISGTSSVNLGTVSPGANISTQVTFQLNCAGNRHVDSGQIVQISLSLGSTIPPGSAMGASNTSIGPIPASWPDDATMGPANCGSPAPTPIQDNGNSNVTITAPLAPGTYTYTAKFDINLSPAGTNDTSSVTGSTQVTFSLTVASPSDTTAPTASPTQSPPANANGWNNSDVTITWNWTDNAGGSGIDSANCTTSSTSSGEGNPITLTATCKDLAGNTGSASYDVKVDKTPPNAPSANVSPAPNGAGWNNSTPVSVSFSSNGDAGSVQSGVVGCSSTASLTTETSGTVISGTCADAAGNISSFTSVTVKIDKTAPNAPSANVSPAPNGAGWNNSTPVSVSFSSNGDAGSVQSGVVGCSSAASLTTETAGTTVSGSCTDAAGNASSSTSVSVKIDASAPTFGSCPAGGPFLLGSGSQSVGPISVDASISGLDAGLSTLSGSVDTSSVGLKTVNFSAVDNADNSAGKACSYSVIYNFSGFFQPVENPGPGPSYVFNRVKAGSAIPLKFSLSGNQGLDIMAGGYPKSENVSCTGSSSIDDLTETVTAGNSSLSYDATNDQYNYVWKTDKAWASKCRKLTVRLIDGTDHVAYFMFTK